MGYYDPYKKRKKIYIPYYHLYVLKLEHGKYYVGISHNVKKRYETHISGLGAEWTKIHRPIRIMQDIQLAFCSYTKVKPYEDAKTIEMMKKYGRENVRGGIYCAVDQAIVDSMLGEELCNSIDVSIKKTPKTRKKKISHQNTRKKVVFQSSEGNEKNAMQIRKKDEKVGNNKKKHSYISIVIDKKLL